MKTRISLSIRNSAQKGTAPFFLLVMRYNKTERFFPAGSLVTAKQLYMDCQANESVMRETWEHAHALMEKQATA